MPKLPHNTKGFLADLPLFKELRGKGISSLAARATEIDAPRGTVVFRRGDRCVGFHVVVFGQIKLSLQTHHGDERVIALMGPGQTFGESVMFIDQPYRSTAETLADSKLVHIAKATVLTELDRNPGFARHMIANLSRRLNHLISEVEGYTMQSGTQRVIGYLLSRLPENSRHDDAAVKLPAKKGIIASQLNLTHEHFSRILHDLVAQGMIEVRGREIRLIDFGKLRTYTK